jgi:hypothetical protein
VALFSTIKIPTGGLLLEYQKHTRGIWRDATPDLVVAEALVMPKPNGLSTVGHEIGHSYHLPAPPPPNCEEEYDCVTDGVPNVGNYAAAGIFVSSRILIPENIPEEREVLCVMGGGDHDISSWESWIDARDYQYLLISHKVSANQVLQSSQTPKVILASGTISVSGQATLDNWYLLDDAHLSSLIPGPYRFEYWDASNNLLNSISFDVEFNLGGVSLDQSPFAFTIPYVSGTARIVLKYNDAPLASKTVSPHSPSVTVISPNGGEVLSNQVTVSWSGSDADGDELSYAMLISSDNGATWETAAIDLNETSYTWDISALQPGSQYLARVIATDGFNTGEDTSDAPFTKLGLVYLPLILRNH